MFRKQKKNSQKVQLFFSIEKPNQLQKQIPRSFDLGKLFSLASFAVGSHTRATPKSKKKNGIYNKAIQLILKFPRADNPPPIIIFVNVLDRKESVNMDHMKTTHIQTFRFYNRSLRTAMQRQIVISINFFRGYIIIVNLTKRPPFRFPASRINFPYKHPFRRKLLLIPFIIRKNSSLHSQS